MKPTNETGTMGRSQELYRTEIQIDASLTANAYAHVHHADALRLLEQARHRFLESQGHSLARFLERGLLLMVSRVDLRYRRELRQGKVLVTVECPAAESQEEGAAGGRPMRELLLEQRILLPAPSPGEARPEAGHPECSRERVAVEASIWQVFVSAQLKRSVPPPDDLKSLFGLAA